MQRKWEKLVQNVNFCTFLLEISQVPRLTKWRIPVRLTFMSVRSYFGSLFRVYVPVSLIYHNYFLSTNEARRKKRYGIFRNFWFLKFLVIVFRIFIQSRSHCIAARFITTACKRSDQLLPILPNVLGNFPGLKLKLPTKKEIISFPA